MPILHSTKDLKILEPPTGTNEGVGIFEYTDNYTVFHYGRMPDLIPGKGEAACRMAAFNFTMLEAAGVRTHLRRYMAPHRIEFDLARVPQEEHLEPGARAYLIPIQVIVRNAVPQGSSLHRRLASGVLSLADAGLRTIPATGERLERPLIEFASMLEDVNRFLDRSEAQHLAGLSDEQFHAMCDTALTVNDVLTDHARRLGLEHCDGKFEFLLSGDAHIVLADSPGTPDESRLMFDGVHCGKQVLRNWYVDNGLEIPVGRLIAQGVPRSRWPAPASLPPEFLPAMTDLYRSLAEAWTGDRKWNAPSLRVATQTVADLIG